MQYGHFTVVSFLIFAWICLLVLIRVFLEPSTSFRLQQFFERSLSVEEEEDIDTESSSVSEESSGDDEFRKQESKQKTRKYHVPKFMLELYEKNKGGSGSRDRPDIVRSLIPKRAGPIGNEVLEERSNNHLLVFDLPSSNEGERFVSAELKILTVVEIGPEAVAGVRRQLKISVYDDTTRQLKHLEKVHVAHSNNTWLSFNLTQPVVQILQNSNTSNNNSTSKFLKIVISISAFLPYYESGFRLSLMPITEDFEHDYPILLLSYSSGNGSEESNTGGLSEKAKVKKGGGVVDEEFRKKRSLEEDYEEETNHVWDSVNSIQAKKLKRLRNTCRRKPLYISFAEIDYDVWIVQPQGYEAYQCQGKCFYPVAEHLNPTKHAIVQALLHSVSPSKASRSCCVPTSLDSISILYVDSNGVLTYRYAYKDMVVVDCGCR